MAVVDLSILREVARWNTTVICPPRSVKVVGIDGAKDLGGCLKRADLRAATLWIEATLGLPNKGVGSKFEVHLH